MSENELRQPVPDTVWDFQKAQTLAPVIQKLGVLKTALAGRDHNRMLRAREYGLGDPYSDEEFALIDLTTTDTPETVAADQAEMNQRTDDGIALYEAAYDLNPPGFSVMPTNDFIDVAQRINGFKMKMVRSRSQNERADLNVDDLAFFTIMAIGHREARRSYEASPHVLERALNQTEPSRDEGQHEPTSLDKELAGLAVTTAGLDDRQTIRAYAEFIAQYSGNDGQQREALEQQFLAFCELHNIDPTKVMQNVGGRSND